ncbi:MAG: AmmeMemoRadiSam system radical SAM enzyme [Phycisphaerae bacterium]|nr:AmmeMemoRadiSam system radical SAM enzyme [Phycisphaerae bacterium]
MDNKTHKAVLWNALDHQAVQCKLCSFRCKIAPGELGICQVRKNMDGALFSLNYHSICSAGIDPIEKKPLFHFQPGQRSFSISTMGCNFQCDFCQNWQISQTPRRQKQINGQNYTPQQIVDSAIAQQCRSISYTYTEPTIFMEIAADCGRLARQKGLANVFVSNGYMTAEAIDYARDFLDAVNVDLKAFTNDFYRDMCKASLKPVLETLKKIAATDIWLEVTTLVIPGLNDSNQELKQLAGFIADELGPDVPWHVSRFHPTFERTDAQPTPTETLVNAYQIGKDAGLHYVYVGNIPGCNYESTYCPDCGNRLIERVGYQLGQYNIINAACPGCGAKVAGKYLDPVTF